MRKLRNRWWGERRGTDNLNVICMRLAKLELMNDEIIMTVRIGNLYKIIIMNDDIFILFCCYLRNNAFE